VSTRGDPRGGSRHRWQVAGLIAALAVMVSVIVIDARRHEARGSATGSASLVVSSAATPSPAPTTPVPTSVPSSPRPRDVYAAITSGLATRVAHLPVRVYVPNNLSNDVSVIDPKTFKVLYTFATGSEPQHVSPSWDLRHLFVGDVYSNTLTEVDPRTGRPVRAIPVPDPYNLYFTPDGRQAIDVEEGHDTLAFYDPRTWKLRATLAIPFRGPDHLDFSASGSTFLISTEYAGTVIKVDAAHHRILGSVALGGSTVDVKLAPDGRLFYVANQRRNGVSLVDPSSMREVRFIPTGAGAHGFAVSRNTKDLYVSNRLAGSISVISFSTNRVIHTWHVGGSPDMLQVSADGRQLWATNRFNASVSVIDTRTGRVLHTIPVGVDPHGLTLFPQPGRFSLGHNGVYR
jgi:YVTN family beta-propeller protein